MFGSDIHEIAGLVIGQTWEDPEMGQVMRVVAIDPDMHSMEAEDGAGAVVVDDIVHFRATHVHWPLAG